MKTTRRPVPADVTLASGIVVHCYRMAYDAELVAEALEPDTACDHFSITHLDGRRMGKVSTRFFKGEMPVGIDARFAAVAAHYTAAKAQAYAAILEALPQLADGTLDDGDIFSTTL